MYDLVVIGGGPGGYVAAIKGAQSGQKVLLVEKDALGGTCLNRGCIPTKCFVHDTRLLQEVRASQVMTGAESLGIDISKMLMRKKEVVDRLVNGVEIIVKSHGIEIVQGQGELIDAGRTMIHYPDGSSEEVRSRSVILATGSRPAVPPFVHVDGGFVQTTDHALDTDDVPENIAIMGGGVIGMEMATIYLNMGCNVTILELLPDILMTEDEEVRKTMRRLLRRRRAKVHVSARVKDVNTKENRVVVVYEDKDKETKAVESDRLLVATGRTPVLDGIDAERLGLKMDGPFVKVNSRCETNLPGVYAIGDLVGGMMLAHKASAQAEVAVSNIAGSNREFRPQYVPRCIWALEEVGSVGLTEKDARATGRPIRVGKFSYRASGAAQAMGSVEGFVKIVGDAETGEIMGVHIMGAHATDLIGEPVMAMTMEAAVEDMAECVKPHPTFTESIMEAALDWSGRVVHSPKKRN
ncbi:MAG: dihydrolipoyl dehydrogenase [Deltaproteobacteria bacterium]|nr:dihydrolipoyl dehydrogenase [Deltaproteobacteria bacterium]